MRLSKNDWAVIAEGLRHLYRSEPHPFCARIIPLYRYALKRSSGKRKGKSDNHVSRDQARAAKVRGKKN